MALKSTLLQRAKERLAAVALGLFDVALTCLFAWLLIELGDWMIAKAPMMKTTEHANMLSKGGSILSWMGAVSVLVAVFELVLWPWYSLKDSWNRHKNDPAFAGRLGEGWCILIGLAIHALIWSSA